MYDELRKLAAQKAAHEKPGQTLQATALAHKTYLRLGSTEQLSSGTAEGISSLQPPHPSLGGEDEKKAGHKSPRKAPFSYPRILPKNLQFLRHQCPEGIMLWSMFAGFSRASSVPFFDGCEHFPTDRFIRDNGGEHRGERLSPGGRMDASAGVCQRRSPRTSEAIDRRGLLTPFQVAAFGEGRGASLRVGNYDILDRLGAGGMGTVFKARHRRMKRIVALKVLAANLSENPVFVKRFQREVETIAAWGIPTSSWPTTPTKPKSAIFW